MTSQRGQRIVHVLNELRPSGMERMLVSGADHLISDGDDVFVVGRGREHPYANELRAAGYQVVLIETPSRIVAAWRLLRLTRRIRPDVVHLHSESTFGIDVLVFSAATPGAAIVRTIHNVFQKKGARLVARRLQARILDSKVEEFIACSEEVAENERFALARRCLTIWNWTDARFHSSPRTADLDPTSAIIIGNCSEIKNHEFALDIAARRGDVVVTHIGKTDGAGPAELRQINGSDYVESVRTSDPLNWLLNSGVYLMPSLHEGMPVAAAEALATGLYVLVADSPGLRWVAEFPGARVLPLEHQAWADVLDELVRAGPCPPIRREVTRFHPSVGAAAYRDVQRRISARD